jgi:hypothetical protein
MRLHSFFGNFFKAGSSSLSEFERAVSASVLRALSPIEEQKLSKRIGDINLVQRLDGGREVNCYAMHGGNAIFPDETRLDTTSGERLLAKLEIKGPPGTENSCSVWLIDGNFFAIEFKLPTEHANALAIANIQSNIYSMESAPPK